MSDKRGPSVKFDGIATNIPTTACLATAVDESGEILPIIPGMALFLIEDPLHPELAVPFTLSKVSLNKITLRLRTVDGAVQDYEYKCTSKQLKNAAAVERQKRGQN